MVPYERDVISFTRQLLEGLVFIHDQNIVHLDIKVRLDAMGNLLGWCYAFIIVQIFFHMITGERGNCFPNLPSGLCFRHTFLLCPVYAYHFVVSEVGLVLKAFYKIRTQT